MRRRIISCILVVLSIIITALLAGMALSALSFAALSTTPSTFAIYHYDFGGLNMFHNKDPSDSDFLFEDRSREFKSLQPDREALALEQELRKRNKLFDPLVAWLTEKAVLTNDGSSRWASDKLKMILEAERIEDMRTSDPFRPLAPPQLISRGEIHLISQFDGSGTTAYRIERRALSRGVFITGLPGGGKTRFLIWLCKQLNSSGIPFFVISPKGSSELKPWAQELDALCVDTEHGDVSIDLSPPPVPGLTYETWLSSLTPLIGDILGLIYGIEIIQQGGDLCIEMRNDWIRKNPHR